MEHKSKHVTTSVPSITIKFDACAEKIEELYASDDEQNRRSEKSSPSVGSVSNLSESDSSPLKYLPKLVKRSTSVDVTSATVLSSSPPSDPWRFFSDITGKITKSVEEKISEIKARNQEEGSPHHKSKNEVKTVKDSKENSSLSDSEELSESSISKTCGIFSTTEGVEMSSDEDTPSIEKDKEKKEEKLSSNVNTSNLRHRFRFIRNKTSSKEGTVRRNHLSKLYNINTERVEQALPEDSEDVESAIDALEEANLKEDSVVDSKITESVDVLKVLCEKFVNLEVDKEKVLNVKQVTGKEIRRQYLKGEGGVYTVFAPTGFVDLRPEPSSDKFDPSSKHLPWVVLGISLVLYSFVHWVSSYLAGFLMGLFLSYALVKIYLKLDPINNETNNYRTTVSKQLLPNKIMEIQAVKEYQPLTKYEGWVNEYPDTYNPNTYHISQTQSVFLRLQGNLLRVSHSKTKIPKRAMWNESEMKPAFTHHRIYNLTGAKVSLLPDGLARVRLWSKKYPICVTLNVEQMNFDESLLKLELEEEEKNKEKQNEEKESAAIVTKEKRGFFRKKDYSSLSQRFSKLTEGEEFASDESRASTPSPEASDVQVDTSTSAGGEFIFRDLLEEGDSNSVTDNGSVSLRSADVSKTPNKQHNTTTQPLDSKRNESPSEVKLYLFGRTDREKEDWFRRLTAAARGKTDGDLSDSKDESETTIEASNLQEEYIKYMAVFNKPSKQDKLEKEDSTETNTEDGDLKLEKPEQVLWVNALIGRVLFDCVRDPNFTLKVRERIQRKLCSIKLPYFIEELLITELSLGKSPPFIQKTGKPSLDERGMWVDLGITYEGLIVLTLQTKLNLMKLKNPQGNDKPPEIRSAIYHSDVDDSAESSSDEDGPQELPTVSPEGTGSPVVARENPSKKLMKMVDRIAESKFFQAATENRYIKKAMEGVSNTDLRLTVEVKAVSGTVVLNIPAPPSDRVWVGFKPVPEILISARPIVGERNISYIMVTSWIEKKLLQEFQKFMVIPNMEDFIIPVMTSKLPE